MNQLSELKDRLWKLQDVKYRDFHLRLIPESQEELIGVRTPEIRKLAREIEQCGLRDQFIGGLPHESHEENRIHTILINRSRNPKACLEELEDFLPYVHDWAICDSLNPKVLAKDPDLFLERIQKWLQSDDTYTVRFGILMLMKHFLDEKFDSLQLQSVLDLKTDEYYINMARAWYLAEGIAKREADFLPVLEEKKLDDWTWRKAISKSCDSYRVPEQTKAKLRALRKQKGEAYG